MEAHDHDRRNQGGEQRPMARGYRERVHGTSSGRSSSIAIRAGTAPITPVLRDRLDVIVLRLAVEKRASTAAVDNAGKITGHESKPAPKTG